MSADVKSSSATDSPPSAWRDRTPEFSAYSARAGYTFRRNGRALWVLDSHRTEKEADANDYVASVFFIHGLGGRSEHFFSQMEYVLSLRATHRFRVIAMDLYGHGRSVKPDDPSRYARRDTLDDIEAVVAAHASRKNYMIGHSMGAGLCLSLATHPARTTVANAEAVPTPDKADTKMAAATKAALAAGAQLATAPGANAATGAPVVRLDRMLLLGTHPIHHSSSGNPLVNNCWDCCLNLIRPLIGKLVAKLLYHSTTPQALIDAEGKVSSQNPFHMIRYVGKTFIDATPLQSLKDVSTPIYMLHGRDDAICKPAHIPALALALPNACIEWLQQTAHNFMLERAELTNAKVAEFVTFTDAQLSERIATLRAVNASAEAAAATQQAAKKAQ